MGAENRESCSQRARLPERQARSYTVSVKAGRMPRARRGLSTIWITPRNAPTPMLAILYLMKAARWFIPESSRALEVQPVPSWYR